MKPNRLLGEKSPYLLQHAHNPVDWYPWGDEAFETARTQDKPIFLSIGYSTCYWCHVMEREVFENRAIAEIMNKTVVSIKVDREERPDIDRIYMSALQAMTGSGGWPLSMFLTHNRKPFWGATYIPPVSLPGRVGFGDVVTRIHEVWTSDRNAILETGDRVTEHLRDLVSPAPGTAVADVQILDRGFDSFSKSYDALNAGFGHAPKFPRPVAFSFLFRCYKRTGNKQALNMSLETLRAMFRGGVYDHVGGGFHRYATDAEWHVPHFEKMLYDQAQLVVSYLDAFQITGEDLYANVARDVLTYVRREMTHSAGAFYSAQDAESALSLDSPAKKKEGAFYTWTEKELKEILPAEQLRVVQLSYGTKDTGNVRADPHGEFPGLNILHIVKTREEVAKELQISADEVDRLLAASRSKLMEARNKRPRPHLDDKILVSWNGLMISAFARAAQVLQDKDHATAAVRAAGFILDTMDDTIVLKRRFRDGDARIKAQLADYAFLIQGLIDLYEATSGVSWLKKALALTERMIDLFYDAGTGGFFDASNDEPLLVRTKEYYDGAEPTGNSIAILSLLRLAQLTDNKHYDQVARESLQYFADKMALIPEALPQFLAALDFSLNKPMQIVIAGRRDSADTIALLNEVYRRFIPNKVLLFADDGPGSNALVSIAPFMKEMGMIGGRATAYVCVEYTCQLPVTDPQQLAVLLDQHGQQKSPIRS